MSKARNSDKKDPVASDATKPTQASAEGVVDTAAAAATDAPGWPLPSAQEPAQEPAATPDAKPPAATELAVAPVAANEAGPLRPLVVGIGASAGGL